MPISSNRCQELFDYLETMRLPNESLNTEIVPCRDEEKKDDNNTSSPTARLNDPSIYSALVPFLRYDENKETIVSRTAKGINESKLNPFELNWMEITLYSTDFVRQLLENIDSPFIKDVAQAIDDEDAIHWREDGQYTNIASDSYGTGQGNPLFYSCMRDNWNTHSDYPSAVSIAEGILDKRNKADAYRQKVKEKTSGQATELNRHIGEIVDKPESHLHVKMRECNINQSIEDEINSLKKECDEWKNKYKEAIVKGHEKAFNSMTGTPCFTSRQMGIFLTAVGKITEKDNPPGKTTLGGIVEKISGYKSTTAGTNMKGAIPKDDTEYVAKAIESKFPNLAAEVRKI